jgi:hypothetical protein
LAFACRNLPNSIAIADATVFVASDAAFKYTSQDSVLMKFSIDDGG